MFAVLAFTKRLGSPKEAKVDRRVVELTVK
jgi:hypothetical protein